ncbi:Aliphatic sulfonates import ATP-binding protein SsuB [compost metagenome]
MSCPPVILMDEPLSALDDVTRKEMQDLIMLMNKETKNTIVMVTHNINDANKMADNIIKL